MPGPTRPDLSGRLVVTPNSAGWDATLESAQEAQDTFMAGQPFAPAVYTIASGAGQLPAASSFQYCLAMVSDAASGKRPDVVSDGVHWLYSDGSVAL